MRAKQSEKTAAAHHNVNVLRALLPLFCMKVNRSSRNSFLFGSLSSSYNLKKTKKKLNEKKTNKHHTLAFILNSCYFGNNNTVFIQIIFVLLTFAKSLEASPLPLLLSASSAQPAFPFYKRHKTQIKYIKNVTNIYQLSELSVSKFCSLLFFYKRECKKNKRRKINIFKDMFYPLSLFSIQ